MNLHFISVQNTNRIT